MHPDQHLGPYRLVAPLGAGGMGEVWKAEDTRLGRMVAIKVLPSAVSTDAEAVSRLKREARTAAQLYHANIATIHSIEEEGELLFIVMELVDGEPLSALIRRGALHEADVCRIGRGVADALAEAHEHGIIHRDIKPDNILIKGSRVKVLDFGIAKRVGVETAPDAPTTFVTQQGMIIGTVTYMSPEQALGKALDPRTDLFSLGVVLYEAATGRVPFAGETVTETLMHIIRDEPAPASRVNPAISPGLNAIINRCLRKQREDRYASAAELSEALERQLAVATTAPMTEAKTVVRRAAPTVLVRAVVAKPRRALWPWIAAALVVIIALAIVAMRWPLREAAMMKPPAIATAATTVATAAPEPPSTTTVTVTESAAPVVVEAPATESVAPPAPLVEAPRPSPRPVGSDAPERLQHGIDALLARDFATAVPELELAAASPELGFRDRDLARLGLAVAADKRALALAIARNLRGDPDAERIVHAFPDLFFRPRHEGPGRKFPRRP